MAARCRLLLIKSQGSVRKAFATRIPGSYRNTKVASITSGVIDLRKEAWNRTARANEGDHLSAKKISFEINGHNSRGRSVWQRDGGCCQRKARLTGQKSFNDRVEGWNELVL